MLTHQQRAAKGILGGVAFLLFGLYFLYNREQARPLWNDNSVDAFQLQQKEAFLLEAERSGLGSFNDTVIQEFCKNSSWVSSSDTIVHCHRIFGGIGEWQRGSYLAKLTFISKCKTRDSRLPTTYHRSWGRPDSPNDIFTG